MDLIVGLSQCGSPIFSSPKEKGRNPFANFVLLFGEKIVISHSSQILIYLQSIIVKQETERFELTY